MITVNNVQVNTLDQAVAILSFLAFIILLGYGFYQLGLHWEELKNSLKHWRGSWKYVRK